MSFFTSIECPAFSWMKRSFDSLFEEKPLKVEIEGHEYELGKELFRKENIRYFQVKNSPYNSGRFKRVKVAVGIDQNGRIFELAARFIFSNAKYFSQMKNSLAEIESSQGQSRLLTRVIYEQSRINKKGERQFELYQPYYNLGDLFHYVQIANLDLKEKNEIAIGALTTLVWMHERGIVHRDLKPDHIVLRRLSGSIDMAICDLDSANSSRVMYSYQGTPQYCSPEMRTPYCKLTTWDEAAQGDIWSMGLILYYLYLGHELILSHSQQMTSESGCRETSAFPNPQGEVERLISDMLSFHPGQRPTAQQALDRFRRIGS